jgi:hypothetical protein
MKRQFTAHCVFFLPYIKHPQFFTSFKKSERMWKNGNIIIGIDHNKSNHILVGLATFCAFSSAQSSSCNFVHSGNLTNFCVIHFSKLQIFLKMSTRRTAVKNSTPQSPKSDILKVDIGRHVTNIYFEVVPKSDNLLLLFPLRCHRTKKGCTYKWKLLLQPSMTIVYWH